MKSESCDTREDLLNINKSWIYQLWLISYMIKWLSVVRIDNENFWIEYIYVLLDYGESNKKGVCYFLMRNHLSLYEIFISGYQYYFMWNNNFGIW